MSIDSDKNVTILVTGGTGLLGNGIKYSLENANDERFAKRTNENWVFVSSKEADLRYVNAS